MAIFNFQDWQAREANRPQQTMDYPQASQKVAYFSLRNNGQEAVVRFMYDSPEEFTFADVHKMQVGDKVRNILCIGDQKDPATLCPLCASGNQRKTQFYIKLVEYVKDENGHVLGIPKVWERSASYARKLLEFFNEYGPLSDVIFKVKRNGAPGDKNTTYEIMPANPAVYRNDLYPKIMDGFNGFSLENGFVTSWTADKMKSLLGEDSVPQSEAQAQPQRNYAPTPTPQQPQTPYSQTAPTPSYAQTQPNPTRQYQVPTQTPPSFDRPRRTY